MAERLPDDMEVQPPSYDESQESQMRRRGEMVERLPDDMVVTTSEVPPPSYDESQEAEAATIIDEMKAKADSDREEMRERLNQAKEVKTESGEGLYNSLFGLLIQDCVDSILKKEVIGLTVEMCRFRRNISEKMQADNSRDNAPMNIARLPEGFNEAWRLWRLGDTEEGSREEASYQALLTALEEE